MTFRPLVSDVASLRRRKRCPQDGIIHKNRSRERSVKESLEVSAISKTTVRFRKSDNEGRKIAWRRRGSLVGLMRRIGWRPPPRRWRLVSFIASCFFAISTHAEAESGTATDLWMSDQALRAAFAGRTIAGRYVDGRTFRESYARDGGLTYSEPRLFQSWRGRWSIIRGRFCTIYDNSGTGGCYRVRRVSRNCFEFFFETRTEEEARRSTLRRPTWTARAWRAEMIATCRERPLV